MRIIVTAVLVTLLPVMAGGCATGGAGAEDPDSFRSAGTGSLASDYVAGSPSVTPGPSAGELDPTPFAESSSALQSPDASGGPHTGTTRTSAAPTDATASSPAPMRTTARRTDTGLPYRRLAIENENLDHQVSRREAKRVARSHDVVIASPQTYPEHVRAMRQVNPDLLLLAYMNGMYAQRNQGSSYPASWYSRDQYGNKIRSQGFGNYLMKPTTQKWVRNRQRTCAQLSRSSHYDGCSLDLITTAPLVPGYNTGLPINPRTGTVWTERAWMAATTQLASAVKKHVSPRRLWVNGFTNAHVYFRLYDSSLDLADVTHGALTEGWLRNAYLPATWRPSLTQWEQGVRQLTDLEARGHGTGVTVKFWGSGTMRQKRQGQLFALGTFLLGTGRRSSFTSIPSQSADRTRTPLLFSKPLGQPTEAHSARRNGVFQRPFGNGLVLVNPTDSRKRVDLKRRYRTVDGRIVERVRVRAGSAVFLLLP